jgi:hypothetical protein
MLFTFWFSGFPEYFPGESRQGHAETRCVGVATAAKGSGYMCYIDLAASAKRCLDQAIGADLPDQAECPAVNCQQIP